MKTFAESLKMLRESQNITQKDLAERVGLSISTIGMYESGKREPSFEILEILSTYFNTDMNTLLGKLPPENPANFQFGDHFANLDYLMDKPELLSIYNGLCENDSLRILFDKARKLTPEDMGMILNIIDKFTKEVDSE